MLPDATPLHNFEAQRLLAALAAWPLLRRSQRPSRGDQHCARLSWKPLRRRLASSASKPPMNAPTRRRKAFSHASAQKPFEAGGENSAPAPAVLCCGDTALEVCQDCRHLGVAGVRDAPALDLHSADAAEPRCKQAHRAALQIECRRQALCIGSPGCARDWARPRETRLARRPGL
jgi:hypothetical protein